MRRLGIAFGVAVALSACGPGGGGGAAAPVAGPPRPGLATPVAPPPATEPAQVKTPPPADVTAPPPTADAVDASVVAALDALRRDVGLAAPRVHRTQLGQGSWLLIASDPQLLGAELRIEIEHTTDWTDLGEEVRGYAAGQAAASALNRRLGNRMRSGASDSSASGLLAGGVGGAGGERIWVEGYPADLMKRLPALLSTLVGLRRPTGDDLARTREHFEVRPLGGVMGGHVFAGLALSRAAFAAAPASSRAGRDEHVASAHKVTAAEVAAVIGRWRSGHVRIAVVGPFGEKAVDEIEQTVTAAMKGWRLREPLPPPPAQAAPRQRRVERVPGRAITALAIGQVLEAADDTEMLALELAGTIIEARLKARLAAVRLVMASVNQTGPHQRFLQIGAVFPPELDADRLDAAVTDELSRLVAGGPTAAELAAAQVTAIQQLSPLMMERGPRTGDLLEDAATGRTIADRLTRGEAIAAIHRADVAAALRARLDPTALISTMAGDVPVP